MSKEEKFFGLKETISALRAELQEAMKEGNDEKLRFNVNEIDVELKCAVKNEGGVEGGVKFWVINYKAGVKVADEAVQTINLKLGPRLDGNGNVLLSAMDKIDDK